MQFLRKYRSITSVIFALIVCLVWAIVIGFLANKSGGDNGGGYDAFGFGHFLLFLISAPFIYIYSSRSFYKFLKPKDSEQENLLILQKSSGFYWLILVIVLVSVILYVLKVLHK
jgi:membrane protease YdiL (CAAX protease family)